MEEGGTDTQACTQRISEEPQGDKIGFLLVEGFMEYPIKKGVTMIGRDSNKCDIVLEDDSVSKVHAVIRIKKASEFFLIDMNSTNGTKCKEIVLKPQFPTKFHYDDKIEFGSVFALLRRGAESCLEDECQLPMTQVLDTPARHRSTENTLRQLTIPESPEMSDKDDSFLVPSRPQSRQRFTDHKNNNNNTVNKESSNESLFWKASSRSPSLKFDLDESTSSINDSGCASNSREREREPKTSINEMDTQIPAPESNVQGIHLMKTQIPEALGIHMLATQMPYSPMSDQIHNMETQIPEEYTTSLKEISVAQNVPKVVKVVASSQIQLNLCATGEGNESSKDCHSNEVLSIYEAETQVLQDEELDVSLGTHSKDSDTKRHIEVSESDEEIMCEEFDTQDFELPNSQAINIEEIVARKSPVIPQSVKVPLTNSSAFNSTPNKLDLLCSTSPKHTDSNANKTVKNAINDDDSTDCEDEEITCSNKVNITNNSVSSMNITGTCSNFNVMEVLVEENDEESNKLYQNNSDMSDVPTQILPLNDINKALTQMNNPKRDILSKSLQNDDINDVPTQIINPPSDVIDAPIQINSESNNEINDAPTQVIIPQNNNIRETETQERLPDDDINDALTQIITPLNDHINDIPEQIITPVNDILTDLPTQIITKHTDINDMPTQDIITEKPKETSSPFKIPMKVISKGKAVKKRQNIQSPTKTIILKDSRAPATEEDNYYAATQDIVTDLLTQVDPNNYYEHTQDVIHDLESQNDEIVQSSQEDHVAGERFKGLTKSESPSNLSRSSSSGTDESEIKKYVSKLSKTNILDIVGAGDGSKNDMSDLEDTPRKEFDFDELPLSEDISQHKTTQRTPPTVTSSEEEDQHSAKENSDSDTPVVHRKKKRINKAKVNLTSRLDPEILPTRMSMRNRKPTEKMKDLMSCNDSEDNIEVEIIKENIAKLKGDKSHIAQTVGSSFNLTKRNESETLTKGQKVKTKEKDFPMSSAAVKIDEKLSSDKKCNTIKSKNIKDAKEHEKLRQKRSPPKEKSVETKEYSLKHNENTSDKNKRSVEKHKRQTKKKSEITIEISSSTESDEETRPLKRTRPQIKNNTVKNKHKSTRKTNKIESSTESDIEKSLPPIKRGHIPTTKTKIDLKNDSPKSVRPTVKKDSCIIQVKLPSIDNEELLKLSAKRNAKLETEMQKSENLEGLNPAVQAVRRSNRGRNSSDSNHSENTHKDKNERTQRSSKNKTSVSPKYDQSRAYSMIDKSDSSVERVSSPQPTRMSARKRGADSEVPVQTPLKKIRPEEAVVCVQQMVLFTAYDHVDNRNLLQKLGAKVVEDPKKCTVVVTKQVKRTIKFLCAVSLGRPIVGDSWVHACRKAKELVDPWAHLLEDAESEKKFKFSLKKSLRQKRNFLTGYNITSTPKAMPPPHEIKVLVECSGGKWKEGGSNWIVVSNSEDKALWAGLRKRGATVVSNEFILSGVLRQVVDLQAYRLPM